MRGAAWVVWSIICCRIKHFCMYGAAWLSLRTDLQAITCGSIGAQFILAESLPSRTTSLGRVARYGQRGQEGVALRSALLLPWRGGGNGVQTKQRSRQFRG